MHCGTASIFFMMATKQTNNTTLKLAVLQADLFWEDRKANIAQFEAMVGDV